MRQRRLTQLVEVPRDLDYVESFQALSKVNLELRRLGPSADRLLRRAQLERAVGNHAASLVACQDALVLEPGNGEMHYQVGLAQLYLALSKADILPVGPRAPELPDEAVGVLLRRSATSFAKALELNPNDDDAREDLRAIESILADNASDQDVETALRGKA